MAKLTTREIRERAIGLLQANAEGIRFKDLVRAIAAESPETPFNTVMTQVGELPARHPDLVFRPSYGLLRLRAHAEVPPPGPVGRPSLPRSVAALESLGFVPAGGWATDGPHLRCDLSDHADRSPTLYAFVVEGEVVYVGKSVQPLSKRMGLYGRPGASQPTNLRNNARIRDALAERRSVSVWALLDWEPVEHRGIPVNVAAGIEDALIERMAPPWNGGGRSPRTIAG